MVVGLGNPGEEYADTRHNAGFWVVDSVASQLGIEVKKRKFGGRFGECEYAGKKLILLKPMCFMNLSGQVAQAAVGFYKLQAAEVLIVSDDMALEPGQIRLRRQGSAGGQKGLADIICKLGTEKVGRLRVGIGQSEFVDPVDYVLGKVSGEQKSLVGQAVERAREAVLCWVEKGIEAAMNEFNQSGQ